MLFKDGPEVPTSMRGQNAVLGCLPLSGDLTALDRMVGALTLDMGKNGLVVGGVRVQYKDSRDLAWAIGSGVAGLLTDDYPHLAPAYAGKALDFSNPLYNSRDQVFHPDGEKGPPPVDGPQHLRITIGAARNPDTDKGIYGTVVTTNSALKNTRTPGVTDELPEDCWRAPNNHILVFVPRRLLHGAPTYRVSNEVVVDSNDRIAVTGGISPSRSTLRQ